MNPNPNDQTTHAGIQGDVWFSVDPSNNALKMEASLDVPRAVWDTLGKMDERMVAALFYQFLHLRMFDYGFSASALKRLVRTVQRNRKG